MLVRYFSGIVRSIWLQRQETLMRDCRKHTDAECPGTSITSNAGRRWCCGHCDRSGMVDCNSVRGLLTLNAGARSAQPKEVAPAQDLVTRSAPTRLPQNNLNAASYTSGSSCMSDHEPGSLSACSSVQFRHSLHCRRRSGWQNVDSLRGNSSCACGLISCTVP
ncbi:uncharacterized protein CC84DRAFT_810534 [Paraphaeosphaeria sporulosa]|uniref:Uncharacterized protein n=1 Tax=Paraphaeosphaeria sporulosa TaxID=1460663 RepID=A0A177CBD1_9PLEO|nr:uncharacterized protein CC84DRAFT_810534 [Paraphaeosphaeria sporulosa]OAG04964.1 hypothetical protein CC84DRAFT_810534 [Paraphaeosphaeria sporulosa]